MTGAGPLALTLRAQIETLFASSRVTEEGERTALMRYLLNGEEGHIIFVSFLNGRPYDYRIQPPPQLPAIELMVAALTSVRAEGWPSAGCLIWRESPQVIEDGSIYFRCAVLPVGATPMTGDR